jgi:hypothetical protein
MKKAIRVRLKLMKSALFRDTERCIFCGKRETTREHVYPVWSRKYLLPSSNAKNAFSIQARYRNRLESATFKVKPLRDWQPKCVCADCNNGWMSALERRLEPIMAPLIEGTRTSLDDQQKEDIATWAILKVMVVHHRIVAANQRRQIMKTQKPPERWAVWIGNYERTQWRQEWGSTPFRIDPNFKFESGKLPRGWPPNAHATTQIVKKLFIHVIHGPEHRLVYRWRFTPPRAKISGNLIKIWPPTGVAIRHWPQAPLSDADAHAATYALLAGLMRIAERQGLALPTSSVPTISV